MGRKAVTEGWNMVPKRTLQDINTLAWQITENEGADQSFPTFKEKQTNKLWNKPKTGTLWTS